jgi:protein CpxP
MRVSITRSRLLLCAAFFGALLLAAHPLHAQEPAPAPDGAQGPMHGGPHRMNPEQQLARMTERYGLSEAQQAQLRPILTEENQKREALFQDSSAPREERFAKMKALHEDESTRISAILTEDQRAKFAKDQEHMRQRGPGGPPPAGNEAPPPSN